MQIETARSVRMQTITDRVEAGLFLQNLSQSFADPSSWQDWYVFELAAAIPLTLAQQDKVTSLIRALFPDNEGSILWPERSVICILRVTGDFEFADVAQGLYELKDTPKITFRMLSMFEEHDQARELIKRYATNAPAPEPAADAGYQALKDLVPRIDDLLMNWRAARLQRKGRDKPHVLVVDDDAMLLAMVGHALRQKYEVLTARNGREAMEAHLRHAPDIVFLDIALPDCSGFMLLNYIQQYDDECQIIMFSADSYLKTRIKALSGGADGFVAKPFHPANFENYIARWTQPAEKEKKSKGI